MFVTRVAYMFREAAVSGTFKKERVTGNSVVGIEADSDVTRVGVLLKDAGESTMGKFTKKILWKFIMSARP
jgi:hypothetical protein